jgi:hypothetical protein
MQIGWSYKRGTSVHWSLVMLWNILNILMRDIYMISKYRRHRGSGHMVVGFTTICATHVYHHWRESIPTHGEVYSINFMWSSLSVTCDRSVVFSRYSGFLHQSNRLPWYSLNIVENGIKHHNPNPKYRSCIYLTSLTPFILTLYVNCRWFCSDWTNRRGRQS